MGNIAEARIFIEWDELLLQIKIKSWLNIGFIDDNGANSNQMVGGIMDMIEDNFIFGWVDYLTFHVNSIIIWVRIIHHIEHYYHAVYVWHIVVSE